jgi:hypothetical protein
VFVLCKQSPPSSSGHENWPLRLCGLLEAHQRRKAKRAWKMDFGPSHFLEGRVKEPR